MSGNDFEMYDNNDFEIPTLPGYISVKEAAELLGISDKRIYMLINSQRIRAVRVGRGIAVLQEDIEKFEPKPTGRPRVNPTTPWRIPPSSTPWYKLSILVHILPGREKRLLEKLDEIRRAEQHLFPGSVERSIAQSTREPGRLEIDITWRGLDPETDPAIQADLERFRHGLADLLDWASAHYSSSRILIRA